MATQYRGPQFGLLPDRRISRQTLATSYGIELLFLLLLVNIGLLFPDKLQLKPTYHITELIPRPGVEPKPLPKPMLSFGWFCSATALSTVKKRSSTCADRTCRRAI